MSESSKSNPVASPAHFKTPGSISPFGVPDSIPCSLTTVTFVTTQDRVAANSSYYDGRPRLLSYGVLRSMPSSVHYCDSRHHDALHRSIQLN
ncbi:unnamed protein product [Sphagnum troendelagicum]|uniref:Uncharacterized protein n=1 Tax=Sphagnum troendelagicum TaxID=128251 RepID=A0ABP0U6A5_9BRYO